MTAPTSDSDAFLQRLEPFVHYGNMNVPTVRLLSEASEALAAVTAERDHALEALAATNKLGAFETGKTIGAAEVRKELNHARKAIEASPHGPYCSSLIAVPEPPRYPCDCWKAGL